MDYWERMRFDYLVDAHLEPPDEDEPDEDALDDDTDFRLDYMKEGEILSRHEQCGS